MSSLGNTVAWSHRGGYWKTRYSFASYCYAFLDRIFFSFGLQFNRNPIWRHDVDGIAYTSFYGQAPAGSAIALSFKENVSSNKIYKSMSMESTPNVNGVTVVTVNNSTVPAHAANTTANIIENRGGILYSDIGFDNRLTDANVKAVGVVTDISIQAGLNLLSIDFIDGGWSYNQGDDIKYFLGAVGYDDQGNTTTTYFQFDPNVPVPIANYGQIPANLQVGGLTEPVGTNILSMIGGTIQFPEAENLILYSATPGDDNGEAARGQSLDVVITLGDQPYELYAVNLEYEETDYDHRDERFARRGQTGRQSTTQRQPRRRRRR